MSALMIAVVELVGGPYDGRQMILSVTQDGLPISALRIPDPVDVPDVLDWVTPPVTWFSTTLYRRDVFAEDRDRWIYRPVT